MKKILKHPEPTDSDLQGPHYWKSLDELADTPGFQAYLQREFPSGAAELRGVDRRQFLKVMSASFAFAGVGLAGCRRPEKYVLPHSNHPEEVVHGKPLYYASAMPHRSDPVPLVVKTNEGRPTKIEGNDRLPGRNGSTNQYAQASILDLYDPDRSKKTILRNRSLTVDERTEYLAGISRKYSENGGEGLAFLAESQPSVTRAAQREQLQAKFPKATWSEYDAIDTSNPDKAFRKIYGKPVRAIYDFSKAKRVLSLEADFLYSDPNHLTYTRDFAKARRVEDDGPSMNRLYAAESYYSITGAAADHRLRLASGNIPILAATFLAEIMEGEHIFPQAVEDMRALGKVPHLDADWVRVCAQDLRDHPREALVVAGPHQPQSVHAMAMVMNTILGAPGNTLKFIEIPENDATTLFDLAQDIEADRVKTLVVLGGNPVYNAPADLHWDKVQEKVEEVVRLGLYFDETSEKSDCHINAAHFLESWGDAVAYDGTVLPIQPMILPLFRGLTESEVLQLIINGQPKEAYGIVFDAVTQTLGGGKKDFDKFLHDGFRAGTTGSDFRVRLDPNAATDLILFSGIAPSELSSSQLELRFIQDPSLDDGRFNNNGWLQECPDPVTKLTWDNAFLISPRLSRELGTTAADPLVTVVRKNPNVHKRGREQGRLIEITVNGETLRGPAHVLPGLPDYTVVVSLGYGRSVTGRIGRDSGLNAYRLRFTDALSVHSGATVARVNEFGIWPTPRSTGPWKAAPSSAKPISIITARAPTSSITWAWKRTPRRPWAWMKTAATAAIRWIC